MRWAPIYALSALALAGCGYVGDPLYPALNIPVAVTDLAAVERGDQVQIHFTLPKLTTEGAGLPSVGKIDLVYGPNIETTFNVDRWAEAAKRVNVTAPGTAVVVDEAAPITGMLGKEIIVGVRVANAKGRYSAWSNFAHLQVQAPLKTPSGFTAVATADGVELRWTASDADHFRVFRATGAAAEPVLLTNADHPEYLDKTTIYGESYRFYVQSYSASNDKLESDVAGPAALTPIDKFPPATPSAVTASAGVRSIELAWERNTEPDFKTYRLYRATGTGPFEKIAELDVPNYSDTKAESGQRYRYRVEAVDETGNVSAPSAVVEASLP